MAEKLDIFVCEFITGGGLYNAPLTSALADEGDMMLHALLRDLLEIPDISLTVSRDVRLPAVSLPVETVAVDQDPWALWQDCIAQADLVWLIAPESEGVLERLTRMVPPEKQIGCDAASVNIASSKLVTATLLSQHAIPIVPTWRASEPPLMAASWIAKPDDGAGCLETRYFDDLDTMRQWLAAGRQHSHVIQPWQPGVPASLSMLCYQSQAWLLSANRQHVTRADNGELSYQGTQLNGMAQHWQAFAALAQQVAQAMPGLSGYVGVDLMVQGETLTVLEINPRLTTSYVGLRQATGLNPAGLVLDLLYNRRKVDLSEMERNVVDIWVPLENSSF
jgi:predicted ATP-grasp superfamily ATP-dependent carboligase